MTEANFEFIKATFGKHEWTRFIHQYFSINIFFVLQQACQNFPNKLRLMEFLESLHIFLSTSPSWHVNLISSHCIACMLERVNCRDFSSVSAYTWCFPTGVFFQCSYVHATVHNYLPIDKLLLLHAICILNITKCYLTSHALCCDLFIEFSAPAFRGTFCDAWLDTV